MSGILLSKSFGRQRHEIGRFRDENRRLTGLQIRQTMIGRSFFAVVGTFFSITPALVYLVAGCAADRRQRDRRRHDRRVHDAAIEAVLPDGRCCRCRPRSRACLRLVRPHLRVPRSAARHRGRPGARAPRCVGGRRTVGLRDVRFRYEEREDQATPVSTDVEDPNEAPRSGPSTGSRCASRADSGARRAEGAGKTTITYLVPRLYDVQHGSVTIDGYDVRASRSNRWATSSAS